MLASGRTTSTASDVESSSSGRLAVVVDRQIAVVEVADQCGPSPQAVLDDGFARRGSVRDMATLASQPLS